jgi:hypothetical protein
MLSPEYAHTQIAMLHKQPSISTAVGMKAYTAFTGPTKKESCVQAKRLCHTVFYKTIANRFRTSTVASESHSKKLKEAGILLNTCFA